MFYATSLEKGFPEAEAMLANMSLYADALSSMAFEVAVNKKDVEVLLLNGLQRTTRGIWAGSVHATHSDYGNLLTKLFSLTTLPPQWCRP